ncbi:type I 3-dehydroquinate dehydratase [Amphibacillus sediminis]|uniref:type I 3-dehydroquinate dehydratase n=1 Tax=Amphibacillus sediminis TaxID=360185 RepID=UPI0009F9FC65|nr:type I 3-dehydroquinate dehydratase [Amphibacillus sediminis]
MLSIRGVEIGRGRPKVCLPIVGQTLTEIKKQTEQVKHQDAELAEWRVDFFLGQDIETTLSEIRTILGSMPLIVTFRSKEEGGAQAITDQAYLQLYQIVIKSGLADIIDVELKRSEVVRDQIISMAQQHDVATIVSNHDFTKTPAKEELINRLKEAELIGASISKLAVMPQQVSDVLSLLEVTHEISQKSQIPIVTMAMGGLGLLSRLSGEVFGSSITFASAGQASAPGQINCDAIGPVLDLIHQNLEELDKSV